MTLTEQTKEIRARIAANCGPYAMPDVDRMIAASVGGLGYRYDLSGDSTKLTDDECLHE